MTTKFMPSVGVIFITTFIWMFCPKRSSVTDTYRTLQNLNFFLFRFNLYSLLSTVFLFFFFSFSRLYNMFNNSIFFC